MPLPLRIAHIVPSNIVFPPTGDSGRYHLVRLLMEETLKRGHEVTLFASSRSVTPAKLESIEPLPRTGRTRLERLQNATLSTFLLLQKLYRQADQFDIIHSHFNEKHLFFAPFVKTPTVMTQHWPITEEFQTIFRQIPVDGLHVVPISAAQKRVTPDLPYTDVVHNGMDLTQFVFRPEPGKYLACLSRVMPEKGTLAAIHVADRVKLPLMIAGKSQHNDRAREYWPQVERALIRSTYAKYRGPIPHNTVSDFLGHAKALLFPIEWEEPFGLVMIEAMACGTPVIAFRRGAVPEVVQHGVTGFVVDTVEEMVDAVRNIDQIDRAACRRHVEEHFSGAQMAEGYEHVYQTIV